MSLRSARESKGFPMNATRLLLLCGIVAGPLYVGVGAVEAFTRPGFDPLRHDLSLLANGEWGWVHITLFILAGILTILGSRGARRGMRDGVGRIWGPLLLGLYGLGLIGAGIFTADPAAGFPPGTPADAHAVSWHGLLHLVTGAIGFVGLIASCLVFARRFFNLKEKGWAIFSIVTGIFFLAAFFGIASASQQTGRALTVVILIFTIAVILSWAWLSAVSAKLRAALAGTR